MKKYFPNEDVESIYDITPDFLKKRNLKGLVLDIDNTLVSQYAKSPDEKLKKWIGSIKKSGILLCIVSNATNKRVKVFSDALKVYGIGRAGKPSGKGIRNALLHLGLKARETALAGDQIFTDIYGGNKLGMYTIMVKPISRIELINVTFKRLAEFFIKRKYYRYKNDGKTEDAND